jgi:putative copper export protein
MDIELIVLRLLHVAVGAFWVGSVLFVAIFLGPSVRAAGPAGGEVMRRLMERRFSPIIIIVAAVTVLSGFRLYWRMSNGFDPVWIGTRMGLCYTAGGIAALIAFGIGLTVTLPAARRLGVVMQTMQGPTPELAALSKRMGTGSRWAATFLAIAVILMAVARYA